jgi:pre-mRNA-processing factor 6
VASTSQVYHFFFFAFFNCFVFTVLRGKAAATATETEDISDANYDEFSGYGEKLFDPSLPYDEEDKEADDTYMHIDMEMEGRREAQKDAKEREELIKYRAKRPKLEQQNSEMKRQLASVTEQEWVDFPEPINLVGRRRKKEKNYDRITPTPDNMILNTVSNATSTGKAEVREITTGTATGTGTATDLTQLGTVNRMLMQQKLSGISSSLPGTGTATDMNSYMSSLNGIRKVEESEMGEFKRSRTLFKSYRVTNPTDGRSWVYSARLEEHGGQIAQARRIIMKGTEVCPNSELVWLEAARLHPPVQAKIILAHAVKTIPRSVKIWLFAADVEENLEMKKTVLRKALEIIPGSEKLWEAAINLEESPESARVLLSRAVECVPESVKMWLALAKLETPEGARKALSTARTFNPKEPAIWLTAARLEETVSGKAESVRMMIKRGIVSLKKNGVTLTRQEWLKEATSCEDSNAIMTCQAIVAETIGIGVEEATKKRHWKRDAESMIDEGHIGTARAVYAVALQTYPEDEKMWRLAAFLEREQAQKNLPNSLKELLSKAIAQCPKSEVLRLMLAKQHWEESDIPGAREILAQALGELPHSEVVWLAAVKLETENKESEKACLLLERARIQCDTRKVWKKSVLLEQELGNKRKMNDLLEQAIERFPMCDKLRLLQCHLAEEAEALGKGTLAEWGFKATARRLYRSAIGACPTSAQLLIAAARSMKDGMESLAFLEAAQTKIPKNENIWLEVIRLEFASGKSNIAKNSLAKARKECPDSGILIAEDILTEKNANTRQKKATDALLTHEKNVYVLIAVSRILVLQGRFEEARNRLEKAASINPQMGDVWAAWYAMVFSINSLNYCFSIPPILLKKNYYLLFIIIIGI